MRTQPWSALGILLGAIGLILAITTPLRSQLPPPPREETLTQRLARSAKLSEPNAKSFFDALGPVIREELERGRQVTIPGLGTFRIVRVEEHRDLRLGRPVTIPAVNTVEFLPEGGVLQSANTPGAQPAEVVPPFQYILIPHQTPSQVVPKVRVPPVRVP